MVCPVLNGDKLPYAEVLEKMLVEVIEEFNRVSVEIGEQNTQIQSQQPDISTQKVLAPEIRDDVIQDEFTQDDVKRKVKYRLVSFCININREKTNVILGEQVKVLSGKAYITDKIGDITYRISPLSFYQVNPVQTKVIYDKVREYCALTGDEIVWDLYCGTGTIGLYLAGKAKQIYGVEIVPEAIMDAKENAIENGLTNTEFYTGAAEELAPTLLQKGRPDIIVIDPPRKGCDPILLDTLLTAAPQKIVYVSCDPATLARDLKVLCVGGYELKAVQPIDAFSQGSHVETVVLMTRENK